MGASFGRRRGLSSALAGCSAGLVVLAVAGPGAAAPRRDVAQQSGPASVGDPIDSAEHYKRARQFYQAGDYPHAIAELEAARAKDPTEKVLVYNLAIVHEKRGDIEEALKFFREYATMNLTDEERSKNELDIRRLEGAKKDLEAKRDSEKPKVIVVHDGGSNGRLDVWTIGAAGVAVAGLGVAVYFSLKANADKPAAGFVTGKDGTYAQLQNETNKAHNEAIAADVFYGVGIAGAAAAVLLYALRPKEAQSPPPPASAQLSASPIPGGAAMMLTGAF